MSWRSASIASRLAVVLCLALAGAGTVVYFVLTGRDKTETQRQFDLMGQLLATHLARTIALPMTVGDVEGLQGVAGAMVEADGVSAVVIVDGAGDVLFGAGQMKPDLQTYAANVVTRAWSQPDVESMIGNEQQAIVLGASLLQLDEEVLRSRLRRERLAILALVLAVTAGALLVSLYFLHALLHRPIADVLAAVGAVADGDFSRRLPTGGSRELAALGEAINQMARRLGGMMAELRTRNRDLNEANQALRRQRQDLDRLNGELTARSAIVRMLGRESEAARLTREFRGLLQRTRGYVSVRWRDLKGTASGSEAKGATCLLGTPVAEQMVVLRISHGGSDYGEISVEPGPTRCIDAQEMALLQELCGDLGMALSNQEKGQQVARQTADLSASLAHTKLLIRELHHRVKNNLQLIASLMRLQMRRHPGGAHPQEPELQAMLGRLQTMGRAHDRLFHDDDMGTVSLRRYLTGLAADLRQLRPGVTVDGRFAEMRIGLPQAVPVGLIVNELATNALKHAFPRRRGTLRLRSEVVDGDLVVTVEDDGIGCPPEMIGTVTPAPSMGLGMTMVVSLVTQLGGAVSIAAAEPGTRARVVVPQAQAT